MKVNLEYSQVKNLKVMGRIKKNDWVKTWTNNKPGKVVKVNNDGTVEIKYPGSKVIEVIDLSMCELTIK